MKLKELYLENKEHRYNTITRVKKENITLVHWMASPESRVAESQ